MNVDFTGILAQVFLLAPPILLALTVHEASHGLVAWWRGDPTARLAGRLTLNPLRHLDPVGTLVFFISAMAGAGFGWAKPVPVNLANLRNPRRDVIWVSAAGPAANILAAIVLALLLNSLLSLGAAREEHWWLPLLQMLNLGVQVNVVLACFNLIPLPPLDGSGILSGFLPPRAAARYQSLGRYGFFILLALLFLPRMIPGLPDPIHFLVVYPATTLIDLLLPWWR